MNSRVVYTFQGSRSGAMVIGFLNLLTASFSQTTVHYTDMRDAWFKSHQAHWVLYDSVKSLQANGGIILQLDHDSFLCTPSKIIT
jgi:hypothetical protein